MKQHTDIIPCCTSTGAAESALLLLMVHKHKLYKHCTCYTSTDCTSTDEMLLHCCNGRYKTNAAAQDAPLLKETCSCPSMLTNHFTRTHTHRPFHMFLRLSSALGNCRLVGYQWLPPCRFISHATGGKKPIGLPSPTHSNGPPEGPWRWNSVHRSARAYASQQHAHAQAGAMRQHTWHRQHSFPKQVLKGA